MTRAAFRHLRQRASSRLFFADRVSWAPVRNWWRDAPSGYGNAWVGHAPIAKRGQKR